MTSGSSDITSSHSWALLLFWRAKVKLKLVSIQLPNSQQVPKKSDPVSSFRFSYNKTQQQFFIFQKTLLEGLGCKKWDFEVEGKNRPTNKQIYITGNFEQTNAGNFEQTNMAQWQWCNNWQLNLTNSFIVEECCEGMINDC